MSGAQLTLARAFLSRRANPLVMRTRFNLESGKIGWIFLWLIGVPIPILLIFFLLRGCT